MQDSLCKIKNDLRINYIILLKYGVEVWCKHTLSIAKTPGSFLPLRNSHTTEAPSIMFIKDNKLFSRLTSWHAIVPTTVISQLHWLCRSRIFANLDAPFVSLLESKKFTGPIQITFCKGLKFQTRKKMLGGASWHLKMKISLSIMSMIYSHCMILISNSRLKLN